jgi:hypothetical protein
MGPSAQLTSVQLKEINADDKNTDKCAREVKEQVEDGEEILDPANSSSVMNKVCITTNKEFEYKCVDAAVRQLNGHPIHQS